MDQRNREKKNALSSSNETHSSYLPSLLAHKPLSVALFPTSATPQPHHPFRHAVIPPNLPFPFQSLPTGYPAHPAQVSPTSPLTQLSQSLSLLPHCKSIETTREIQLLLPMPVFGHGHGRGGSSQTGEESMFTQSLPSVQPRRKEQSLYGCKSQSLAEPAIYKGMRVLQLLADFHTDIKVHP